MFAVGRVVGELRSSHQRTGFRQMARKQAPSVPWDSAGAKYHLSTGTAVPVSLQE